MDEIDPAPTPAARSLQFCLSNIPAEIKLQIASHLIPEFRYAHLYKDDDQDPNSPVNRGYGDLLNLSLVSGISRAARQNLNSRFITKDFGSIVKMLDQLIKSPEKQGWLTEMHSTVDLFLGPPGFETANQCFQYTHDGGTIQHLKQCEAGKKLADFIADWENDREVSFTQDQEKEIRQLLFYSLLCHMPNLRGLRFGVHCYYPDDPQLTPRYPHLLNCLLDHRVPLQVRPVRPAADPTAAKAKITPYEPCKSPCPSLQSLGFHQESPSPPCFHPLLLWPLIGLPHVRRLEMERCHEFWPTPITWTVFDHRNSAFKIHNPGLDVKFTGGVSEFFGGIEELRLKGCVLTWVFMAMTLCQSWLYQKLQSLEVIDSVSLIAIAAAQEDDEDDIAANDCCSHAVHPDNDHVYKLLELTVAGCLRFLALDDISPSPKDTIYRYGIAQRLTRLDKFEALEALYAASHVLFGLVYTDTPPEPCELVIYQRRNGADVTLPLVPHGLPIADAGEVELPPNLKRLEIREDPWGGSRWADPLKLTKLYMLEPCSAGKLVPLMKNLAERCPVHHKTLKNVVFWYHTWDDDRFDWSKAEQDEVKELFKKGGVEFEYLPYTPWPETEISGWRELPGPKPEPPMRTRPRTWPAL
ncbi:hypothetical protein B0T19DRAFT_404199 [Cercophora scortea]|uniref:Uncharacterized protein n=1 Tax=Cercophora scortea TaxID=314031 RepID=A0AAE0I6Y5_9PEZI|nr:hypothetical protein B0T19DRAFT_404199 [Cercophora scortea]